MDAAKADAAIAEYRLTGLCLRLALRVRPLELPRSRRLRRALEHEAELDPRVRRAYVAAVRARAARPSLLQRFRPAHDPQIYY